MTRPAITDLSRLDPETRAQHEQLLQLDAAPITALTPDQARARVHAGRAAAGIDGPALHEVQDLSTGTIKLRLYRPAEGILPVILFLHGGGWVVGDLDTHDPLCRFLAQGTGCAVLAVDYRLAPEHPFPAAFEDSRDALVWLGTHAADLGLDPSHIALLGDSAGGNLAASLAIACAQDRTLPQPKAQFLYYPVTALTQDQDSYAMTGKGWPLNAPAMAWFINHYTGGPVDDWRAAPLTGTPAGSAPARVVSAGYDPLCDEGIAYAAHLAYHGVPVTHQHYPGQAHGFLTALVTGPVVRREIAAIKQMMAEVTS